MAEDPIKLFSSRGERFPEPTGVDTAYGVARAALAAIPVIGGPITEALSLALVPAVAKRREKWLKELADALEGLEKRVDGFSMEALRDNEVFVSVTLQAAQSALRTHQQAKRKALQNAVLNSALGKSIEEEKPTIFVSLIDVFTGLHIEILELFADPSNFSASRREQLRAQRALTDPIVLDLNSRGLLNDPRPYVARNRESIESQTTQGWSLSPLGNEFLSFIRSPQ